MHVIVRVRASSRNLVVFLSFYQFMKKDVSKKIHFERLFAAENLLTRTD